MVIYSFIIPHHNSPILLNRCLDSIPQREDIEIIVVDDNSDVDQRPQISRQDVKLSYSDAEHTKGAGRARNHALKTATGKWLVFADADDFFVPNFLDVLDEYKDADYEVVYHPAKAVDTITLQEIPALLRRHNQFFANYDGTKQTEDYIRFKIHSPWWKMVRKELVEKYDIWFEEVPKGNDVFFTYQVGYFAKKIGVSSEPLYVYTFNRQGITNGKKNKNIYLSVLRNKKKTIEFYKFIGHSEWCESNRHYWLKMIKKDGIVVFLQTLFAYIINYASIKSTKMQYVDEIRKRERERL